MVKMKNLINEIEKLYQEGTPLKQAMHRGVGQQAQRLEKSMYWYEIEDAIKDYVEVTGDSISIAPYKVLFDDTSIVGFIESLACNVEFHASREYNELSDMQVDALILSRLLKFILGVQ